MANYESDASVGSDIEADSELEFDDVVVPDDPLIEEQWLQDMFEDSSDEEFTGFEGSWQTDNFRPRDRRHRPTSYHRPTCFWSQD